MSEQEKKGPGMTPEPQPAGGPTPAEGGKVLPDAEPKPTEGVISQDELDKLLKTAPPAETKTDEAPAPMTLTDLGGGGRGQPAGSIDMLMDVTLNVRIELGRTNMAVENVLAMQRGSVVTLDKLAGDFVDVLVNDNLVARGEVLILNDNFCVRIAEIVSPEERAGASTV